MLSTWRFHSEAIIMFSVIKEALSMIVSATLGMSAKLKSASSTGSYGEGLGSFSIFRVALFF
jgi:hypothetical protein